MKKLSLLFLAFAFSAAVSMAGNLKPEEAAANIGKKATVAGVVTKVAHKSKGYFFRLGDKGDCTIAILLDVLPRFGNLNLWSFQGQKIAVTGPITADKHGKPEIIVTQPYQIVPIK